MPILSHLSIGVRDLKRAGTFYDSIMKPLGVVRLWEKADAIGYGAPGGEDELALFVQASPPKPGPGFHIALKAPDAAAVTRFWEAAMAAGGVDEGPPGERPRYGEGYYAAFIRDLDGYKLEAKIED